MGRVKITMKFIQNAKARKLAFIRRQKGLTKKVYDFSKKFGVEACLVVYDGDGDNARPIICPEDPTIAHSMLRKYEDKKNKTNSEKFDLNDYFENRKNMTEVEISKLHKKIVMNKYPTWSPCLHAMEGEQLKDFIVTIDAKIQACNHKINMLKNMPQSDKNNLMQNRAQENVATSHSSQHDLIHSIPQIHHTYGDLIESVDDNIINEDMDFTNYVSLPPISSTNQINEHAELDSIIVEPGQEWTNQLDDLVQLDDMMDEPDLTNFEEWANQLDDDNVMNWNSQPDLFARQDISFML